MLCVHGHGIWWSYLAVVLIVLWSIEMCWLLPATAIVYIDTVRTWVVLNLCKTNFIIAEIRENVRMCRSTCIYMLNILIHKHKRWKCNNNFICKHDLKHSCLLYHFSSTACLSRYIIWFLMSVYNLLSVCINKVLDLPSHSNIRMRLLTMHS